MARTKVESVDDLEYGDNVEIHTLFEDKTGKQTDHVFYGQVSDIEPQQDVVTVTDKDSGQERMLYWGASDEEDRTWYKLTDDDEPVTAEIKIGKIADDYKNNRDELISKYELRNRNAEKRHQRELEKLAADYRDAVIAVEAEQLDRNTNLFEDEKI